jgi:cyclopropane fatty-acyl-phospholipid synthase-like methyltransferase
MKRPTPLEAARAVNRLGYDTIAPRWDVARVRLSNAELRLFDLLLREATPGAWVLDLGCGTGRPIAQHVLARQFAVTGVDQSEGMLSFARSRMPGAEWIHSTLEQFVPQVTYCAVIAWDSLFHIPRQEHLSLFRSVRGALAPGGRFVLTVGGSEHPAFTSEVFGQMLFFDSHSPEQAIALLQESGFEVEHSEFLDQPTL